jgi:hypothetical protein
LFRMDICFAFSMNPTEGILIADAAPYCPI